jgi:hypothetical protein
LNDLNPRNAVICGEYFFTENPEERKLECDIGKGFH